VSDLPSLEHDPGQTTAATRADAVSLERPVVLRGPTGGRIHIGTASWTDPTLTKTTFFYPKGTVSAEDRLRFYASRFPIVEVDSSYYALPSRKTADLWVARTPDEFTFNVKAYALMTGQPGEVKRLPKELREALPDELKDKSRVYAKDLPREIYEAIWTHFIDAVEPLRSSGKLGAILLQYPKWFLPNKENVELILEARERLGDIRCAVEFRNHRWYGEHKRKTERTLTFLADHDIPYVIVDGPQGLESSVPPVVAVTSQSLAMVRMHGRRSDLWEKSGVPTVERYRYLYDEKQLAEWIGKIEDASRQAKDTYVLFNNCYGVYGTTNAMETTAMMLRGLA
jgi:uncharacterized protein YecE (DUF72 family)